MVRRRLPGRLLPLGIGVLLVALISAACTSGGSSPAPSGGPCPATPEPTSGSIPTWSAAGQDPSVIPVIVSSSGALACGPTRFLFSFVDKQNVPVATPDRNASVAFYDLGRDPGTSVASSPGTFIWAIEGSRGVYVANVDFPTSGLWGAEFSTAAANGPTEKIRVQFEVAQRPIVVAVGDPAPAVDTPTLADVGGDVTKIATDAHPVKAFYEQSVRAALAARQPFVLIFATPKFCVSAQCGPTLDRVKPLAAAHPGLTFINAEPYKLKLVDGQLQPVLTDGSLTPTAATDAWHLLSEPWVFVVDKTGIVRGSFEGIVSNAELERAIQAVTPPA